MKMDDTIIGASSILKCCAFTLLKIADDAPHKEVQEGMEVMCRSGNRLHRLVLLNGRWRWVDPRAVQLQQRDKIDQEGGLYHHVTGRKH